MSFLPCDPVMLLSYVNTALRDRYPSLDTFCEEEDTPREKILAALRGIGYVYDGRKNAFVPQDT